ncbi:MAG: DUF1178 domain-containing protein [Deltaproteobacteria bacterium]|nr:MAG: DUF1178 domain-containing protein [Deltaproteobacteria bacterium]
MIAFDLQCTNDHTFEGWFEDNRAYENQKKKGMITCPVCNDTQVTKVLSSFAIRSSGKPPAAHDRYTRQMRAVEEASQQIAAYVEKNFDNVGADFTKEALKIHYGVTEPRNIRGVSTEKEEKTLKSEGIEFFKIPLPARTDRDS